MKQRTLDLGLWTLDFGLTICERALHLRAAKDLKFSVAPRFLPARVKRWRLLDLQALGNQLCYICWAGLKQRIMEPSSPASLQSIAPVRPH
jgi:hypothetical protein